MFEYGNWEHKISYFKFENWWLNVEGFNDMVQRWNGFVVEGCPDYKFSITLKMLKQKLEVWSKTTLFEFSNKRNNLLEELAETDRTQDNRDLTEDEMMVRATIFVELEVLAKNEEASWRKKSRVL